MNQPYFVGISGKKQHGKDTFATMLISQLLSNYGIKSVRYGFADPLKRLCVETLGIEEEDAFPVDRPEERRAKPTLLCWGDFPGACEKYEKNPGDLMNVREVLQIVGTEVGREGCPSIWALAPFRKVWDEDIDVVVITDCRFPDEADNIVSHGGEVLRVVRPGMPKGDNHPSEVSLDNYGDFTHYVSNLAGLSELEAQAKSIASYIYRGIKMKDATPVGGTND